MRVFGLHPDQVIARAPAAKLSAGAMPSFAVIYGALSLGAVSVLAYSIWAFRLMRESSAMYAGIAIIYIGLAGVVLGRLVAGPGALPRFAGLFAVAFLAYAIAWCAFWFGLKGKHLADLWGAIAGLATMTWLVQRAFGQREGFLPVFLVLLGFHSLGYYAGEAIHVNVRGATGKLLWGAAHGLGFGAGIGYLLHRSQEPLRLRLRPAAPA